MGMYATTWILYPHARAAEGNSLSQESHATKSEMVPPNWKFIESKAYEEA